MIVLIGLTYLSINLSIDNKLIGAIDEVLDSAHTYCSDNQDTGLLFTVPRLVKTTADKLSTFTNIRHPKGGSAYGDDVETVQCNLKLMDYFEGQTVMNYLNHSNEYKPEEIFFKLGKICNQLFKFLRTQQHLIEQLRDVRGGSWAWQMSACDKIIEFNLEKIYPFGERDQNDKIQSNQITLINQVLKEYRDSIQSKLKQLPEYIIHSDLCNMNILINTTPPERFCLIDFGDIQVSQQCVELAICMMYNILEQERQPFDEAIRWIPHWIYKGYQTSGSAGCSLDDDDLLLIPSVMKLRLSLSLLNGLMAIKEDPANTYVMHTNRRGWQLLELLSSLDPRDLAEWWRNGPESKR